MARRRDIAREPFEEEKNSVTQAQQGCTFSCNAREILSRSLFLFAALAASTYSAGANTLYSQWWITSVGSEPPIVHRRLVEGFHGQGEAEAGCAGFVASLPFVPTHSCVTYQYFAGSNLYASAVGWVNGGGFPANYTFYMDRGFFCLGNTRYIPPVSKDDNGWCAPIVNRFHTPPDSCPVEGGLKGLNSPRLGNPIQPMTGAKRQSFDIGGFLGLPIELHYNSQYQIKANITGVDLYPEVLPSFGKVWTSSLHRQAFGDWVGATLKAMKFFDHTGHWRTLQPAAGPNYTDTAGSSVVLSQSIQGGWQVKSPDAGTLELMFDSGKWRSIHTRGGATWVYTYSRAVEAGVAPITGLIIGIRDQFGREIRLDYEAVAGGPPRIYRVRDPDGNATHFQYSETGYLNRLIRPGEPSWRLLYEDAASPWALTGLLGPDGVRHSTYLYDGDGNVRLTELSGGANRFAVSYITPPRWNVSETLSEGVIWRDHYWQLPGGVQITDPTGSVRDLNYLAAGGGMLFPRLANRSQPAGSGCSASTARVTYDALGNKASEDFFNGNRSCYLAATGRGLEVVRVEGLAGGSSGASCAEVTGTGTTLPTGSRKVSAQWHSDWSLKTKQAEPGRLTTSIYNGQPDAFNGGSVLSCAPGTALLPDGKPIAVLCKQVEQATVDVDGSQGHGAALQQGVPARVKSWTYNQFGQVLTETDPLNNATIYEYYASTVFTGTDPYARGHTKGDLKLVTNAAGQQTKYNAYNKSGLVLETQDANGVLTTYSYDARQRLASTSVGGQTTTHDYWPTGLLKKVTQPDGVSFVQYTYDDAHRLRVVQDNMGNRVTYTLDNMGNRKAEEVVDPGNSLRRQLTRGIDALGRVEQVTGRQ